MTKDRELAACVERELRELLDLIAHNRSMPSPVITPGCEAYVLEYFRNRRTPAGEYARDAEIERLNAALRYEQNRAGRVGTHGPGCETWRPGHYECLERAHAALLARVEAAERDADGACVALVADIRFACGDNGKRMQPELVEFIRGLALDAGRYRWLRENDNADMLAEDVIDDAIDQAMGE